MRAQPREIASPQRREACSELWKDSASCLFQIFSVLSTLFVINLSHHLSVMCRGEDLRTEKKVFWPRRKPRENVSMLTCFSYPVVPRRIKPRQVTAQRAKQISKTPSGSIRQNAGCNYATTCFCQKAASSCPAWTVMPRLMSPFSIKGR